ncbi:hypothetical protein [Bradyrhizobium sp. SZCCHNS1054]|uniref:hypothetical protein n=1 Tax=Bradyrhizobium sp. SZCCHNS1054 TaxID=3057301 RepID=UPI002915D19E|nr:hypothetical protein [Bradyrhizobium sp. SZCCHNS1054]
MNRFRLRVFLLTAFAVLSTLQVAVAGEVCRRICIEGYFDFCERAHPYQKDTTNQIDHVVIYVERAKDGTFNYASNVLSEGAKFPTKIVGFKDLLDLDDVFFNLDEGFGDQLVAAPDKVLAIFHETAEVFITAEANEPGRSPHLDTKGIKNIHIVQSGH